MYFLSFSYHVFFCCWNSFIDIHPGQQSCPVPSIGIVNQGVKPILIKCWQMIHALVTIDLVCIISSPCTRCQLTNYPSHFLLLTGFSFMNLELKKGTFFFSNGQKHHQAQSVAVDWMWMKGKKSLLVKLQRRNFILFCIFIESFFIPSYCGDGS